MKTRKRAFRPNGWRTRPLRTVTVRLKDPRALPLSYPRTKALGSSVPLDVLVGASRLVQFFAGHMVPPLEPIRPGIGPEVTALATPHTGPERWHRNVIRPGIHVHLSVMAAGAAGDVKPADADLAHVAERHRADRFVIPGHTSKLRTDREQNQGRCHAVSEPVYAADQFQPHQSVAASEGLSGPCAGGFLPGVPLGCCCLGMGLRSILRPQPSGEAIADQAGITVTLPKPQTSSAKAEGRFGKQDFVYVAAEDVYRCPAEERLTYRFAGVEDGKTIRRYWTSACKSCALKAR